jgi:hypothetical protein
MSLRFHTLAEVWPTATSVDNENASREHTLIQVSDTKRQSLSKGDYEHTY